MIRRYPTSLSHEASCQTPSPISSPHYTRPLRHRMRKAKSSSWRSTNAFKLIVGIEAAALLSIWIFFTDRLRCSRLWTQYLNVRSPARVGEAKSAITLGTHQRGYAVHEGSMRRVVLEIPEKYKGPTLVIGGSDGSGTRAFADFVIRLGVPLRIDDKQSLDVHGGIMFNGKGWPPLGNLILNATHSANYSLDDLSHNTRTTATKELLKLKSTVDSFQKRFYNEYPNITRATGVSVGFKAPITVTLLPLLKEAFGPMKYLHVVRDGRDVSLSTNKSPVQKFYKSMYPDAEERVTNYSNSSEPVLAMHLWNDWNTQALDWERAHANMAAFDFLVLRSEDLLDPTKKFESLVRLAQFIGSPITTKELCCMSREKVVDMGQSLKSSELTVGQYGSGVTRMQWNHHSSRFIQGDQEAARARVIAKIESRRQKRNTTEEQKRTNKEEPKGKYGKKDEEAKARLIAKFQSTGQKRNATEEQNRTNKKEHKGKYGKKDEQDKTEELSSVYRNRIKQLASLATDEIEKRREARRSFANAPSLGHATTKTATAGQVYLSPKVQKRYGKWREMLKEKPHLAAKLQEEGAKGLSTFGYEPQTSFYDSPSPTNGFQCDESVICDEAIYQGIPRYQLYHTYATKK